MTARDSKSRIFALVPPLMMRVISALVLAPLALAVVWKGGWVFHVFLVLLILRSLYEWIRLARRSRYWVALTALGTVYILYTGHACWYIQLHYSFTLAALFLFMIWSSDSGAYIFGKWIRGPKLAQTISPNKTWAGFCGALAMPAAVAAVYQYAFADGGGAVPAVMVGMVIGFVSQSGDLLISWLKRHAGAKDSGHLIPGHGGLLDRIDGLLLAAPVYLWFLRMLPDVLIP